ncbi:MAG: MBL fold metallo-hydrolase [Candidatus Woesearchaeota archaeon]
MSYEVLCNTGDFVRLKNKMDGDLTPEGLRIASSEVYIINRHIMIDSGSRMYAVVLLDTLNALRIWITHIIPTHLHADHLGWPAYFPEATTCIKGEYMDMLEKNPLAVLDYTTGKNKMTVSEDALKLASNLQKFRKKPLEECVLCEEVDPDNFGSVIDDRLRYTVVTGHARFDLVFSYRNYIILGDCLDIFLPEKQASLPSGKALYKKLRRRQNNLQFFRGHEPWSKIRSKL